MITEGISNMLGLIWILPVLGAAFVSVLIFKLYRVVVQTNEVHIVQSAKKTVSYGKDQAAGNTYYKWPSWLPKIGVKTITLPVSVFDVDLEGYAAYDKGRVPFQIDIMAFFRITDSNMAAQRVHSVQELGAQLQGILQGACRSILATSEIEEILEGRSTFGEKFTKEVDHNLVNWGVQTVKCIELMDIRDAQGSKVIENIMAKKKSLIEMQSRTEVAGNMRSAQMAEIDAKREVAVREQEAIQAVGIRQAEAEQQVGIWNERAKQAVKDEARTTAEKTMAVVKVEQVRKAEIERDVQMVAADQDKQTSIIKADGHKQQTVLVAEGDLSSQKLHAEGILAEGTAKAEAEKLMQLAPVAAQITLAKEIGQNAGYQTYLVSVRQIEANQAVGIEQAQALKAAEIKVIANTGNAPDGVKSAMEVLTSKGGTQIGAMLEAFKQTPAGEAVMDRLGLNGGAN